MLNKYSKNAKEQDFEPTRISLEDKLKKIKFWKFRMLEELSMSFLNLSL